MFDLNFIAKQSIEAIQIVGDYIHEQSLLFQKNQTEHKGKNDLVSYVDKTAEEKLVKSLSDILPIAGFITEEQTISTEQKEYTWIIDPLDGTTNFIHGLPIYSISVGLQHHDQLVLGFVYEIGKREMFHAIKSGGAYLNNEPISCTQTDKISDSLLATGFPFYKFDYLAQYMTLFSNLMQESHGLRRLGSAAVDLAYVACGRFDAYFEYNLNPWDVAGGILIVEEAGGKCYEFNGGNDPVFGRSLIAGNEMMCKELLEAVKNAGFIEN